MGRSKSPDVAAAAASPTTSEQTMPAVAHADEAEPNLTAQTERQESTP